MKKLGSVFSFVTILLFVGLACKAIGIGNQNAGDTNPSPEPSQLKNTQPVEPTAIRLATQQLPTAQVLLPTIEVLEPNTVCQSDKWMIIPTHVYQHPMGDGWKLLIAELVV